MFSFFLSKKPQGLPLLKLHNTLSGQLEAFEPIGRTVKMYNCGPTVYEEQHIGNLRGALLSNTLKRSLEVWGYPVQHVSNITDVGHLTGDNAGDADTGEDRMEASAKKRGLSAQDIAAAITELYFKDLDSLGIDRSNIKFPRATGYIPEQIALVKTLEEKGYTYTIDDGVYFNTAKFPAYGKLGHINLTGQKDGARVEENTQKKNQHDFALWKLSPSVSSGGEQRQQEWPSPWGVGFPGWHIECTAMIFKLLGKQIDIHIGGIDLIPIHHNNEIAQAEAATGKQFVRYWMHNAFITIENKKVSKSLGNTIYLRNIVERSFSPLALRYWYLTGHYRTPMNFTWDALEGANTALRRLQRAFLEMPAKGGTADEAFLKDFYSAMANDLDTPKALARVWDLMKDDSISPANKRASIARADAVLGLGLTEPRASKTIPVEKAGLPHEVQKLATEREEARLSKDFARSDELRNQIESLGYDIQDTPEGQKVTKK